MKWIILPLAALLLSATPLWAQNYKTGVGLRGGYIYGITVKHFVNSNTAIEGIVSPRWGGILLTGLYEKHATAFQIKQLQYYGGLGAHVGVWNNHRHRHWRNHPWFDDHDEVNHTVLGADLILGLEYSFREIPFSLGVDWKPGLNLIGHQGLWFDDVALSLRFLISNL
ncbi:hypothetical protein [Cesiribacter andamanensis]|uniref:Outer membrane protein beta-barrel domain-containing protein n=1 Tax=Cesiribacter andamanensis AMV16 TaxID=1279009 RepID=M7N7N5_9BACT|nr:hypothetical protein [Cesiribacter andamanensis]EMR04623.1 hypothetical protein ADICEAN_00225 [Cesiribacter andamanensis AMV16]